MGILQTMGLGKKRILTEGLTVKGAVTDVKTCWWLKVNTKPARNHMLDGAVFPHIVHFKYYVNSTVYTASRYVNWNKHCPQVNETVTVYYDASDPTKCAIDPPLEIAPKHL